MAVVGTWVFSMGGSGYWQQGCLARSLQLNFNFRQNLGANLAGFAVEGTRRFT